MSTWEDDIVKAIENLGGSGSYEKIYSEIKRIRSPLPRTWQEVIRRCIQNMSSDSAGFKGGRDLFFTVKGLGSGIWGLRQRLANTPIASDLPFGAEEPDRKYVLTYRILRDTALARKIKALYKNACQICGETIHLKSGKTYAEAHHIIPLGSPHDGSDTPGNIVVLCPNHHVLCDYGSIILDTKKMKFVEGHKIEASSVHYHNERICCAVEES